MWRREGPPTEKYIPFFIPPPGIPRARAGWGRGALEPPPLSPPTANRAMHAAEAQRSSHTGRRCRRAGAARPRRRRASWRKRGPPRATWSRAAQHAQPPVLRRLQRRPGASSKPPKLSLCRSGSLLGGSHPMKAMQCWVPERKLHFYVRLHRSELSANLDASRYKRHGLQPFTNLQCGTVH